jgi:hypothetical protein
MELRGIPINPFGCPPGPHRNGPGIPCRVIRMKRYSNDARDRPRLIRRQLNIHSHQESCALLPVLRTPPANQGTGKCTDTRGRTPGKNTSSVYSRTYCNARSITMLASDHGEGHRHVLVLSCTVCMEPNQYMAGEDTNILHLGLRGGDSVSIVQL